MWWSTPSPKSSAATNPVSDDGAHGWGSTEDPGSGGGGDTEVSTGSPWPPVGDGAEDLAAEMEEISQFVRENQLTTTVDPGDYNYDLASGGVDGITTGTL